MGLSAERASDEDFDATAVAAAAAPPPDRAAGEFKPPAAPMPPPPLPPRGVEKEKEEGRLPPPPLLPLLLAGVGAYPNDAEYGSLGLRSADTVEEAGARVGDADEEAVMVGGEGAGDDEGWGCGDCCCPVGDMES